MNEAADDVDTVELAAQIVASYVTNNSVPPSELPGLIASVHASMTALANGIAVQQEPERKEPAVSIKKSMSADYLICLEDGKKFKSLKRHLRTAYNMSPDDYRTKWGLPSNYPMVAPSYAAKRSELARASGLGAQRRKNVVVEPVKKGRKAKA